MAAPDSRHVQPVPGKLVANPTDLSADYPHGGTELGVVRDHVFIPGLVGRPIHSEALGMVVDSVVAEESAVFTAVFREYDDDAVAQFFLNTTTGTGSGHQVIMSKPGKAGQNRPGKLLSDFAVKLLFSPIAVDTQNHILMYSALPLVKESTDIELGPNVEAAIAVMYLVTPDSRGWCYENGRREDLTL